MFFVPLVRSGHNLANFVQQGYPSGKTGYGTGAGLPSKDSNCCILEAGTIFFLHEVKNMLTKKSSKNQVTLPKRIVEGLPETDYFDVSLKGGAVVLRPVRSSEPSRHLATARRKVRKLGLTPKNIENAVRWARMRPGHRK
jgi:hypothetical protein